MNILELQKKLNEIGVRKSAYSLSGGLPNERYCIENSGRQWSVYYSERGQRTGEKIFTNESKACDYLLKELQSDPTVFA